MGPRIRHIAVRFALLLAVAAVVPLVAYGIVSILSLQSGTRQEVIQGNQNVAMRAAEEIRRYVTTNAELLKALAANLQDPTLTATQQDRVLKNYVLQIREFREISLFDEVGATLATSRIGKPRVDIPKTAPILVDNVSMSGIRVDEDLLPSTLFAIHMMRLGGSSASSAWKKCGGQSTASASARTATRWSSRRTPNWSRTAIPTRKPWSRRRET